MKKNQKYTQFKARGDRNVVYRSPLDSTGDGSIRITERICLILESIELHRMFSKSLMDRLSARLLYSPRIYSSTMDPVDFEGRYF